MINDDHSTRQKDHKMSTTFQINAHVDLDVIAKIKTKQSREMLTYLFNTYGYDEVDQAELMIELNTHQKDGKVLSEGSKMAFSGLYQFYRKNEKSGWINLGFITIRKSSKALNAKNELENLKARVKYLEDLLDEAGMEYDPA